MDNINKAILENGFYDEDLPKNIDLVKEIKSLLKKKNAILLAHYYQTGDIQDIADFVGDSLKLAQEAEKTTADMIVFAGVHFMAETAKILNPTKKVLLPDLEAGCSLADSAPYEDFKKFREARPNHVVVSYVNSSSEVKALTDIICTSSNAVHIIDSIPKDKEIIFAPDKNLGSYLEKVSGRKMTLWDGACHVHKEFSLEAILKLKKENPTAKVISHPECEKPILLVSDFIGSTSAILNYSQTNEADKFIVATESGILHQMQKGNPNKTYIPAPPNNIDGATCACNDCEYMKLNNLKKIYLALKYEKPEILMDEDIRVKAEVPIKRMLEISAKHNL